jgi:anti-anti-sigma regulatory factor
MVIIKENTIIIDNDSATLDDKSLFALKLTALVNSGCSKIMVDIGMTSYLPSELMGLFMWKKRELEKKGIEFKIIRISQSLKDLFENTRISDYFELENAEVTSFPY